MKYSHITLFLLLVIPIRMAFCQSVDTLSISGQVHEGAGFLSDGIVMAINTNTLQSHIKKTSGGQFKIDSLGYGNFILYAVPNPSTVPTYLPTYWVNKPNVNNAANLYLNGKVTGIDITLVAAPSAPTGSARIIGRFSYLDGHSDKFTDYDKNWFGVSYVPTSPIVISNPPCETMPILVYNTSNQIIWWTVTDTLGYFNLPKLAAGTYQVMGQRYNYTTVNSGLVTVATGETKQASLQMTRTQVVTDVVDPTSQNSSDIGLTTFPNPFKEELSFNNKIQSNLLITDMAGRLYYQQESFAEETISTSSWPDGIYLLKVGNKVQKLIKR